MKWIYDCTLVCVRKAWKWSRTLTPRFEPSGSWLFDQRAVDERLDQKMSEVHSNFVSSQVKGKAARSFASRLAYGIAVQ